MEEDAEREWEQRFGRIAAVAAFLSGALLLVGLVLFQTVVLADVEDTDRSVLMAIDDAPGAVVGAAVAQALSHLALGVVLWYLFKATRNRRPEVPPWLLAAVLVGPVLLSIATVLGAFDRVDLADTFASGEPLSGTAGETRAEDLLDERSTLRLVAGIAGAAGAFALAIALVLVSIHAMRAGLLSRFIGILGAVVGFMLVILPIPGIREVVQVFWLGALGALFLGRWPGGRGPAWASGRAEPWPSAAQRASAQAESVDQRSGVPESQEGEVPERPASRKKRKRRS